MRLIEQGIAERVLQAALAGGADFSELFVEDTVSNALSMTDGKVENAAYTRRHGAGVRVLLGTRSAYAYTAGTGEASLIATAKAAAGVLRGAPEGQNRAQRQLFLANNRPVCYNVDRWSTCPAPLPGCWHPLWRAYPFPPE